MSLRWTLVTSFQESKMPRVSYQCKSCHGIKKKFYSKAADIEKEIECKCGGKLVRQLSSPNQRSKIIVDNGVQEKAVELDRDIVEIVEDREESDLKRRGDAHLDNLI